MSQHQWLGWAHADTYASRSGDGEHRADGHTNSRAGRQADHYTHPSRFEANKSDANKRANQRTDTDGGADRPTNQHAPTAESENADTKTNAPHRPNADTNWWSYSDPCANADGSSHAAADGDTDKPAAHKAAR